LFDAQEPGREASWASAGMISPAPENAEMISSLPLSLASAALYPNLIGKVQALTGKDVGYRKNGGLDVLFEGDVERESAAIVGLQRSAGLHAEALSPEKARAMEPSLSEKLRGAIYRADEGSVDARAFTEAVLNAAQLRGAEIFAGNGVKAVRKDSARCRGFVLDTGEVDAKWTIVAAGCFSAEIEGVTAYAPVTPAKGQMLALRRETAKIEHNLWLGHKYLVPRADGRIIAGATIEQVGFDRHVTAGGLQSILNEVVKIVPALEHAQVEETWAGLRPDSPDHLPIIGPTDVEGLLIATGHFRSGILLAPITGRLICEWVTTQSVSVDWERFSPMRFLEERRVVGSPSQF
jgi:glycine oxidase